MDDMRESVRWQEGGVSDGRKERSSTARGRGRDGKRKGPRRQEGKWDGRRERGGIAGERRQDGGRGESRRKDGKGKVIGWKRVRWEEVEREVIGG